ncbi:cytosine permease [Azoarcus sp. KH32C]|uniref:purine-cytosine permease family protein n=1 Tax=Azoarcus sp. KH32C TaxID=748247 RepID=UPI0002385D03|nr:permease for cytosine/purines, uracil, thiamine, allantoin transporter [Azoarcus sp. KH32C]BAL27502.1 permease for cytosine/purines, uracil, thiamine, allantoin tranporter [Azoarcus sp. KH32C]
MTNKIELSPDEDHEDFAAIPVPYDERMGKFGLTMAWWALCSAMFWLMVPATLALTLGTKNVLIGLALSTVAFSIINAAITRFSIRTGLSVAQFSQLVFGKVGARLATLIFCATAIYYAVFEGSVIAVAINAYWPGLELKWAYLIVVCYSVPLVFGSVQHFLDKFNGVLLPLYLIGIALAVGMTLSEYGYSDAWLRLGPATGAPENGWWQCFTYFMGVWILMMYTWDFARLGRREDTEYHAKVNFGIVFYGFTFLINAVVGIFIAGTIPLEGGVSEVSAVLGLLKLMGLAGLAFVWVSQTRINTANFYLSSVNMEAFFQSAFGVYLHRMVWTVVVGVIVYFLMLQNVFSFILQALAYQGTFVVAWVAIALVHIYLMRDARDTPATLTDQLGRAPLAENFALGTWLVSSAVGILMLQASAPIAAWSAPITAVVGGVLYALNSRVKSEPAHSVVS